MSNDKRDQQNPNHRAPAQDRAPQHRDDRSGGVTGNNQRGGRIDPVFEKPAPAPRPPKGDNK